MRLFHLVLCFLVSTLAFAQNHFFSGVQPKTKEKVTVVAYTAYILGYSETRRVALWSVYVVTDTQKDPEKVPRKGFPFFTEERTEPQVSTKDYVRTGFSRGHLTPFAAIAYSFGKDPSRETFSMANIVPQLQEHNAGIWAQLEETVSGVRTAGEFTPGLTQHSAQIWVYTGPIFSKKRPIRTISTKKIMVPTSLWKAAIWITKSGDKHACAWIIPHEKGLDPLEYMAYATTMKEVKKQTGVTLVPEDVDGLMDRCDSADVEEALK